MITDNKIDSLPLVMKVMSIVPTAFASFFLYFGFWELGLPLLLVVFMAITAQQRLRVDFDNKRIRNYYRILFIGFGKWKPMKDFNMISITLDTERYRETNYSMWPSSNARMYEYKYVTAVLNLKINNREKAVIAKGSFKKIMKLAKQISEFSKKDIYNCTLKTPELLKYEEIKVS